MTDELERLRLDLQEAESRRRRAEQDAAELKGQLRDCKAEDVEALRQASARAELLAQSKDCEAKALADKLAKAGQNAAEQKVAFDAAVATMDGLRQSNADLNAALARPVIVNQLPAPAQSTAPAAPVALQRPVTVAASSRKSGKVWAIACGAALAIFIAGLVGVFLKMTSINDVDAVTGEVATLAVNKAEPPSSSPTIIKSTTPASSPCPYASLNACVEDMARRIGVAPSDASVQRYGSYSCRKIGCQ